MKVKELIKRLKQMPPNAEVMAMVPDEWTPDLGYVVVSDCEDEYIDLVSLGTDIQEEMKGDIKRKNKIRTGYIVAGNVVVLTKNFKEAFSFLINKREFESIKNEEPFLKEFIDMSWESLTNSDCEEIYELYLDAVFNNETIYGIDSFTGQPFEIEKIKKVVGLD